MPPRPTRQPGNLPQVADRLHSAAIRLLRRLRPVDEAAGLTGPALSALSVVVYVGPLSLGDLARAEQVRPPSITPVVRELERRGLVKRSRDPDDARVHILAATARGRDRLAAGRARRVRALVDALSALPAAERRAIARALGPLERIASG